MLINHKQRENQWSKNSDIYINVSIHTIMSTIICYSEPSLGVQVGTLKVHYTTWSNLQKSAKFQNTACAREHFWCINSIFMRSGVQSESQMFLRFELRCTLTP